MFISKKQKDKTSETFLSKTCLTFKNYGLIFKYYLGIHQFLVKKVSTGHNEKDSYSRQAV